MAFIDEQDGGPALEVVAAGGLGKQVVLHRLVEEDGFLEVHGLAVTVVGLGELPLREELRFEHYF